MYHSLPVRTDNLEPLAQEVFDPNHPATTNMTAAAAAATATASSNEPELELLD